jgi:hypothetical protein
MKNKILFFIFFIFAFESFAKDDHDEDEDSLVIAKSIDEESEEDGDDKDSEDYVYKGSAPIKYKPHKGGKKSLSNDLVFDLGFNDNYQTTDSKAQFKETIARARFYSKYQFTENLSLNSEIDLAPFYKTDETNRRNATAHGGGDRSFEDEGIFARQLNLQYNNKKYSLIAGKFNLNYGKAWNWNRGIWSYELANNYRQTDKIGFGGIYRAGDAKKTGQYNFGLSFFKNDRKYLNNALITRDDQTTKSNAKAGDEDLMQSFLASMDVNFDFGEKEKLTYHFAYINMAVNRNASALPRNKIADQKGYVASMNYIYPVAQNYDIDALIEYNNFKNIDGNSDNGENYLTGSVVNKFYQHYLATVAYSRRSNRNIAQLGFEQQLSEFSVGYEFDKNAFFDRFIIQAGYKNIRNDYKNSLETNNAFGILARYYKNF